MYCWLLHCGNYTNYNGIPSLHSFIYVDVGDVGEPTHHPCSITGWRRITTFSDLESLRTFTWELLCHREEVLSVMRIVFSESVVFHLVFWVSSFSVFLFGLCFCLGFVSFRFKKDTWLFAFHLFSNNVRIADRPQDVLMTVRASSVHGMS